jgi:transcription antitermination protein NusB
VGSRRKGRVIAFQALFAWEAKATSEADLLSFGWLEDDRRAKLDDDVLAFAAYIVSGTIENLESIDQSIRECSEHWDIDRIAKVDLAIIRISAFTILCQPEVPCSVVINEAVEIAKKYGSDRSYKFVNGLLDGIRKNREGK